MSSGRQRSRGADQPASSPKTGQDEILSQEPEEIVYRATGVGRERLDRSSVDVLITGFIGGVEVSLGGLAAMLVLGGALRADPRLTLDGGLALAGLVFPVGFLFVITGRSELFTENFLIPVVAILARERSPAALVRIWFFSLVGNLLGCGAVAALVSVPHAVGGPILTGYEHYAAYKLALPAPGLLVSAMLAGVTMTVLTWLLLAVRHPVGKMVIIWAAGYVLFATNLSHVIVSAAILFVGFVRVHATVIDLARYIGITTFGNLIGGVGLVTLFRVAQAREKARARGSPRLRG